MFARDSSLPCRWGHRRRQGRPRLQWTNCVHAQASAAAAAGGGGDLHAQLQDEVSWRNVVNQHCQ